MENFSDPKKGAKMNYLVVTAHSGDEILGCGGTIRKLSLTGSSVSVCTLDGSSGNCGGKDEESIEDHRLELRKLGVKESYLLEKRRDSVPFSNLVSFIEKCIVDSNADSIITYHPAIDICPVWSKDGKSIFFISSRANKDQYYNVWKMNFNLN